MGKVADFFHDNRIPIDGQKRTKMLALDTEFEDMKSERDTLKSENLHLQAQVKPLEREIQRLQTQVEEKKALAGNRHDDIEERILIIVADSQDIPIERILSSLKLSKAKGDYHLDVLKASKLISLGSVSSGGAYYHATPDGRAYLVRHGLIE